MGVHYYKTCDKCGKVLVGDCLNVKENPYSDYAVCTLKIMSQSKAYRQPSVYLCKECYTNMAIPLFGNTLQAVEDDEQENQ